MDIVHFSTTEEFVRRSCDWIVATMMEQQKEKGHVCVGLSGGSTPKPVYTLLPTLHGVNWKNVEVFLVDERFVPPSDKDSNQRLLRETLLTRGGEDASVVFPDTTLSLPECVARYESLLQQRKKPDLVILGMGEDGHIASLFPPLPPEAIGERFVLSTTTDTHAVRDRISTTLPFLLRAHRRLFLISGPKKAALLKKMQQANEDISLYPAQYLMDERTTWMVGP